VNESQRSDPFVLVEPREPVPGALAVLVRESKLSELDALQTERRQRVWRVRAVISDGIPLSGDGGDAVARPSHHNFFLNENPIAIYLHAGGRNAVYYDLAGDNNGHLDTIEVRVECVLPDNALLLARKPVNALLDAFARDTPMPLVVQRLELLSPADGSVLAYELVLPCRAGVRFGPLGGILQRPPFAAYDALYREAITSSSPYYRLLCAWKVYEGMGRIRQFLRENADKFGVQERLPPDPALDREELLRLGLRPDFLEGMRTANDLFGRLTEMRNGIAHFLIEGDAGESQVYLADGAQLRIYATAAAALLLYAHRMVEVLRQYYARNLEARLMRGMLLPMPANRDMFIVRAKDYGLDEDSLSEPAHKVRYDFGVNGTEVRVTRDGEPTITIFSTKEKDTADSPSALHKFLQSIGRSRVDAHMVCLEVEKGNAVSGVMGNK